MATIQRPVKTYGNRNYAGEVASAPNNTDPILANEVDGDLDTIYAAWNGGVDTVNIKPGSVTEACLATDAHLWTIAGATIKPFDPTKAVAVLGGAAGAGVATVILGSNTAKARVQTNNTTAAPAIFLTANRDAATGAQDDTSKPSWQLQLNATSDQVNLTRNPPGGAGVTLLTIDSGGVSYFNGPDGTGSTVYCTGTGASIGGNFRGRQGRGVTGALTPTLSSDILCSLTASGVRAAGTTFNEQGIFRCEAVENWSATANGTRWVLYATPIGSTVFTSNFMIFDSAGNITITGSTGQKASGTTWSNPSDPRLKQDVAPYAAGLAEIAQLEPITYRLKAQPDGPMCYGFDAEKVRDVFPECVTSTRMKLDPTDEEETDDVLVFDMHPILVALVNAVRELAGKVAA